MLQPQQSQDQPRPHTPQEIAQMADAGMQWVDQFNQNLVLTVQAMQRLHIALDARFTR